MWESVVLLIASFMFILPVFVDVRVSCLDQCFCRVHNPSTYRCGSPLSCSLRRVFHVHSASACRCESQFSCSLPLSCSFCQYLSMWESVVLLSASLMFILPVLVDVGDNCLALCIFYVHSGSVCRGWSQLFCSLRLSCSLCQCF